MEGQAPGVPAVFDVVGPALGERVGAAGLAVLVEAEFGGEVGEDADQAVRGVEGPVGSLADIGAPGALGLVEL